MARSKRQERERRDLIIVLLLTVLCVVLFGVGSLISFETGAFKMVGLYPDESMVTVMPTFAPQPTKTSTQQSSSAPTAAAKDQEKQRNEKGGFGIGFSQLMNSFAIEGFVFKDISTQPQRREVEGKSSNALAALKIVGHGETIESTQMVIHYPRNDPEELKKNLGYMVKAIKLASPDWKDAVIWFYANVAELAKKQTEPRESSVIYEGLRIHLKLVTMPDLLFLTCEAVTP